MAHPSKKTALFYCFLEDYIIGEGELVEAFTFADAQRIYVDSLKKRFPNAEPVHIDDVILQPFEFSDIIVDERREKMDLI